MAVSSSNVSFILIVALNVVQGTLTPNGIVSVDCGNTQSFTCNAPGELLEWTTSGLSGISQGPFRARTEAMNNSRITSPDTGDTSQFSVSVITISGFSISDNGGTIQCINAENNTIRGMASISVGLHAPANVVARATSCDTVTLQWDQPSRPNDITTSVSCTPPSQGCAECSSSPCNITGLSPSTEYVFTVTLNSVMCGTSMNTTGIGTRDSCRPSTNTSAPLAALVLLVLFIPLLYPLGVLIAYLVFFKDKSYCEVFWCCFCCRKDTIYEMNSTELREHREENVYHSVPKKKEVVTSGDEIEEPKRTKQEGVVIDETVQQQGTPEGHPTQKRSRQHKEEVEYQNLGVAKKKEAVTNDDEVKKPQRSKQEVVSTGNVMQQQGNPDGIQYADLDFSEQGTGRNVIHTIVDTVTYADM